MYEVLSPVYTKIFVTALASPCGVFINKRRGTTARNRKASASNIGSIMYAGSLNAYIRGLDATG